MKKILFVAMASVLLFTSCVKSKEFYQGNSKQFAYTPSYLMPTLVGPPINGVATVAVNGTIVSIQCITPGNPSGDALVIDAPVVPQAWEWSNEGNEYRPSGMTYNSACGFSANYGRCYFVEIFANGTYRFWNGVSTPMDPVNTYGWVTSFEYPRTWVQKANLPIRGMVVRTSATNYRLVLP